MKTDDLTPLSPPPDNLSFEFRCPEHDTTSCTFRADQLNAICPHHNVWVEHAEPKE